MGGEGRGLGGQIELLARLSLEIGDLLLSPFEALNLHTLCFLLSIFYLSSLLGPCRCLEGGWGGRGTIHPCAPETLQSPTQAVRRTHSRASGNHCPVAGRFSSPYPREEFHQPICLDVCGSRSAS